jgi:aminoglycoside 6'-N-acetyltransferase
MDGRPVGFLQIIDPTEGVLNYWGDAAPNLRAIDIRIDEVSDLNRGDAAEPMRQAVARCLAPPEVATSLTEP